MYATIRSYSGNTDLADALVERESDIRQVIGTIGGFRAYHVVRGADGETTTISVFDDQSGAEESNTAAAAYIRDNMADMSISTPQVTAGEVVLSF